MNWMLACCGFDCGKCRAFKGNIKNDADREWVCRIRSCVIRRKIENCSLCREYPCLALEEHMSGPENVDKKHRDHIPVDEYDDFIRPYLARTNLEEFKKKCG